MGDGRFSDYLRAKQAPELSRAVEPESWFYWQAFQRLRSDGMDGFGRKPIPNAAIASYGRDIGLTCPIEKDRLARVIIAMDNAERSIPKANEGE